MVKPLLDVHTHTLVSGYAYSSLQEMAKAASKKGLHMLGITEHGPSIPGACHPIYFDNYHSILREINGLKLLMGCEINILNTAGDFDITANTIEKLDLRIAGIHRLCWKGGNRKQNTDAILSAINNSWIHIISHPGDGTVDLYFEPIVKAAAKAHTLLEINSCSLKPIRNMKGARKNNLKILCLCKQNNVPIIIGSDAHISFDIANYDNVIPLLEEIQFPDELIMNDKVDGFFEYLNIAK